jgi:hypothetical protein
VSLPVPSRRTCDPVVTAPRPAPLEPLTWLPEVQLLEEPRTATMVPWRDSALRESGSS